MWFNVEITTTQTNRRKPNFGSLLGTDHEGNTAILGGNQLT